jgi:hypothetical protein
MSDESKSNRLDVATLNELAKKAEMPPKGELTYAQLRSVRILLKQRERLTENFVSKTRGKKVVPVLIEAVRPEYIRRYSRLARAMRELGAAQEDVQALNEWIHEAAIPMDRVYFFSFDACDLRNPHSLISMKLREIEAALKKYTTDAADAAA